MNENCKLHPNPHLTLNFENRLQWRKSWSVTKFSWQWYWPLWITKNVSKSLIQAHIHTYIDTHVNGFNNAPKKMINNII